MLPIGYLDRISHNSQGPKASVKSLIRLRLSSSYELYA